MRGWTTGGLLILAIIVTGCTTRADAGQKVASNRDQQPAPAAELRPCRAADLQAEAYWQGAGGSLAGSMVFTNQGTMPCTLQGFPHVQVVDTAGQVLPVAYLHMEDKLAENPAVVPPGQQATVRFVWSNWCGAGPVGSLALAVTLPGDQGQVRAPVAQTHSLPAGTVVTPRCDVPDSPAALSVGHFTATVETPVERGEDRATVLSWWEGSDPGSRFCLTLAADQGPLAGPCGSPAADLRPLSNDVGRVTQFTSLRDRFALFRAETKAGWVVFDGRGNEVTAPAWQRAIAAWGRLVQQEFRYGRSGASWGLALAWEQEDEKGTGRCLNLQVEVYGLAFASSSRCGGGEVRDLGWGWLTTEELERLYGWLDRLAPFERTAPGRLLLSGSGTQPASEAEIQAISDWAEARFRRQARLLPVDATPQPSARQYISREQAIAAAVQVARNADAVEARLIETSLLDIPTQERREVAVWQVDLVSTMDKRPAGTITVDAATGDVLLVSSPPSGQ